MTNVKPERDGVNLEDDPSNAAALVKIFIFLALRLMNTLKASIAPPLTNCEYYTAWTANRQTYETMTNAVHFTNSLPNLVYVITDTSIMDAGLHR